MTRRITRAKQAIRESGLPFRMPSTAERAERLAVVHRALYLIFNEGYVSTTGASLQRPDLAKRTTPCHSGSAQPTPV